LQLLQMSTHAPASRCLQRRIESMINGLNDRRHSRPTLTQRMDDLLLPLEPVFNAARQSWDRIFDYGSVRRKHDRRLKSDEALQRREISGHVTAIGPTDDDASSLDDQVSCKGRASLFIPERCVIRRMARSMKHRQALAAQIPPLPLRERLPADVVELFAVGPRNLRESCLGMSCGD